MIFGDPNEDDLRVGAADADASLLTLLRIYDTLMALYAETAPDKAARLYNLHKEGGLGSPMPNFQIENLLSE